MNDSWWRDETDLDVDQLKIIAHSIRKDHLITGAPGTGKTNLLVLKALQMHKAGLVNIRLLVSTRSLKEFIAAGGNKYKFDDGQIMTFDGWMLDFLREHQVTPASHTEYPVQRKQRVDQCHQISARFQSIYDAVLVDEGQDCLAEEVTLFKKLGKVCWVAADDKQSIYQGATGYEEWRTKIDADNQTHLRFHYRNGKAICELADAVSNPADSNSRLVPYMRYNERNAVSRVEAVAAASVEKQIDNVIASLRTQLRAYPDEMLGVLTPVHDVLTPLVAELRNSDLADLCVFQDRSDGEEHYMEFSDGKRIFVSTAHSSKGLEARALHIVGAERFWRSSTTKNLVYTTITRAKTSLTIHHTGPLLDFFQSAVNATTRQITQPGIQDLLGGI